MDTLVISTALLSALLHADWNAAVAHARDANEAMTAQIVGSGILGALLLTITGLPPLPVLPWIAALTIFSLAAMNAMLQGYAHGGFGLVYPLSRASAPMLLAPLAALIAHESLGPLALAGIALISLGTFLYGMGSDAQKHVTRSAIMWSLAAGACTAIHSLADAQSTRLSSAVQYGLAQEIANAFAFGAVLQLRGGSVRNAVRSYPLVASAGAITATASYLLILWVWTKTSIAVGAALRDTSLVFGTIIAVVVLKESLPLRRVAAIAALICGAVTLRFSY